MRSGSHDMSFFAFQRLGPPGHPLLRSSCACRARPTPPTGGPSSASVAVAARARRPARVRSGASKLRRDADVVQLARRRRRGRAAASRRPCRPCASRKPATTQSAVRSCFTLTIVRSPGVVRAVERLGDHAVEPGALERARTTRSATSRVGGERREVDRRRRRRRAAARAGRAAPRTAARAGRRRRRRAGRTRRTTPGSRSASFVDPARGRVDALREQVEVEPVVGRDHDLAVDDRTVGQRGAQRLDELREVAGQRLLVAAAELDVVAVAEHDAAEAVPLRLVAPRRRRSASRARASPASATTGGLTGSVTASRACASVATASSSGISSRSPVARTLRSTIPAADALRADDELHRHADEVGVGELHARAHVAVVVEHVDARARSSS